MNQSLPDRIVIMFADVAGSTQLYERMGDAYAHQCISASLDRIVHHARSCNGHLVETIGDEAMLMFADCDDAATAAIAMQHHFNQSPVSGEQFIKIRVGFHYGPIEYDPSGHPFGDTVNVAARVVALCDAGRIIATDHSLQNLAEQGGFLLRPYQTTRVKGKSAPIRVKEVVWDREDATSMFNATQLTQLTQLERCTSYLQLYYMGQVMDVKPSQGPFGIGRDAHCNLVIDSALASRSHASIEYRWGEFILTDHSTNGTHVEFRQGKREGDGTVVRLHRREMALQGVGKIAVGTKVEQATDENLLGFKIMTD